MKREDFTMPQGCYVKVTHAWCGGSKGIKPEDNYSTYLDGVGFICTGELYEKEQVLVGFCENGEDQKDYSHYTFMWIEWKNIEPTTENKSYYKKYNEYR